jgi:O-antigen ligase
MINPIPFGTVATLFAFLSLLGIGEDNPRGRLFAVVAFAAGITGSALSATRGGWIAIPVFVLVLFIYLGRRYGRRTMAITALILAVAVVLAAILARDTIRQRLDETLVMFRGFEFGQATTGEIATLDQRAMMAAYGLEAIRDRPILGYGPQNAVAEVRSRAAADGYTIDAYNHLHNEFITETVGNGIVGLVTLLLVLAAPIVVALRSRRDNRFAERLAAALLFSSGSAIFGLTGIAFGHDLTNSVFVAGLLAISLSAIRSQQAAKP